jgi:hypothetical protein
LKKVIDQKASSIVAVEDANLSAIKPSVVSENAFQKAFAAASAIQAMFEPTVGTLKKIETGLTAEEFYKQAKVLGQDPSLPLLLESFTPKENKIVHGLISLFNTTADVMVPIIQKIKEENPSQITPRDIVNAVMSRYVISTTPKTSSSEIESWYRANTNTGNHTEVSLYKIREAIKKFEVKNWNDARPIISKLLDTRQLGDEFMRKEAFDVIAKIKQDLSPDKLSREQRKEKFRDFFFDENGKNLLVTNDLGIPILFHRGHGETVAKDLVEGTTDRGIRFWGEDSRVARDYEKSFPIVTAYLRADEKNILVVEPEYPVSWSGIPIRYIKESLLKFGWDEMKVVKFINGRSSMSIDELSKETQVSGKYKDDTILAVKVTNLLDYTTLGTEVIPHTQWTIRSDLNIMKSPEAVEFDKTPGPMRILNQKRAEDQIRDLIASAKAAGADAREIEAELSSLVDSAAVRRRNLIGMGLHEETEPDDLKVIHDLISGNDAYSGVDMSHFMDRFVGEGKKTSADTVAKFRGKSYRDLDEDERRTFVLDVMMPKISEEIGMRNKTAGVFSALSDSVVGKGANSLIGGAAMYGDTADSTSISLQFLSKILDPSMDLRDGELQNTFRLFSVDKLNAELNNTFSRSGLLSVKNKIASRVTNEAGLRQLNDTAWSYLSRLDQLPEDVPHRDLIVELIQAVHKHNTLSADVLNKYGNLMDPMNPTEYGTIHKVNNLAFRDQQGFVDALTKNAVRKTIDNKEISVITAEALGWVKINRNPGATDEIVSVTILDDAPLNLEKKEYQWNKETKKLFGKDSIKYIKEDQLAKYNKALTSNEDYLESFKRLYSRRGVNYSAIAQSMTIAKDRYLGIEDGDDKTGKPRSESVGSGRNYSEERILSHTDIASNPELAKYFQKDIYDLIYQQVRSQLTEATMTKYISEYFGVKMSWNDLVNVLRKFGEESQDKANLSQKEQESRTRGFNRLSDIWEQNTGKMIRSKDGLDKYYEALASNARVPVLVLGGIRAALSSVGEVGRAVLASNHNKGMLVQVVPNLIQTLKMFSKNKRQTIQEVTSATHWLRNLTSDHLLARSEMNPENPFGGAMLGSRQSGWFKRWAEEWRAVSDINATETNIVNRGLNRLGIVASRLGAPLAWVNDVTTTLHVWNAQRNLTTNAPKFMELAKKLESNKEINLGSFARLAKECGLSSKEALDLSTAGLLDPKMIEVMIEASKDTANYTDGLLDVQKLFLWAGDSPERIEAINRMGAYINTTSRQTNTDPTLLDLRINQSAYAKAFGVFMQFLLSHSVQEIGRRRRYSTANYGKHLAGIMIMEALTYSLARQKEDDKWIWEEAQEKPIDVTLRLMTGMPMLGSYQYLGSLIRQILQGGYNVMQGDEFGRVRLPDLFSAPAENIPNKGWEVFRDML